MDAKLLAEREAFKKRAMDVPAIENEKRKDKEHPKISSSSSTQLRNRENKNIHRIKNTMGSKQ